MREKVDTDEEKGAQTSTAVTKIATQHMLLWL